MVLDQLSTRSSLLTDLCFKEKKMDRRTLLKGLLGLGIGTGLASRIRWEAQDAVYKHGSISKTHAQKLRALHTPPGKLKCFRAAILTNTNQILWAPRVQKVILNKTEFGHVSCIEWEFNQIEILQDLVVLKLHLIDDMGYLVMNHSFTPEFHCRPKDVLRLTSVKLNTFPT